MILELRNMISGEVTTVDFEFPGNVWQLKCRVARLCSDVPLDGASEGVQLWKVATPGDNGEAGGSRLLTDEYEEIESPQFQQPQSKQLQSSDTFSTPSLSFGYLLKRRATFNEEITAVENMWGIKSFDDFVKAACKYMLWSSDSLNTSWRSGDPLVERLLRCPTVSNVPGLKASAVVSRSGKDQVQEILFYELETNYHMEGYRMPDFFW
eukprot:TRINITY_DN27926_c0_g1_i1.p1 TRINITY_DN27926_c0_g1~~TRINITY_DN27926_c0_g1_i1.p1  ORF type:complete len:209 (-),score=45.88 TRINITY_DN27926_c0_g1_i1:302-928(-)